MKDDTGGIIMRNEQIQIYFKEAGKKELKRIKQLKTKKVPFMEFFVDVGKTNNLIREILK